MVLRAEISRVFKAPLPDEGLAIGVGTGEVRRNHVIGRNCSSSPTFLGGGVNLTISIRRLWGILDTEMHDAGGDDVRRVRILSHSNFSKEISREKGRRWRQDGSMQSPPPCRRQLNRSLSGLTMDEKVERSTVRSLLKGWAKKNIDNEAKRKVKQFVTGALRKEDMQLPTLWASQTEVKKELNGARVLDERRVYRRSVNRARRPSKSCKMFTNWNLDREKVREILK